MILKKQYQPHLQECYTYCIYIQKWHGTQYETAQIHHKDIFQLRPRA